MTVKEVVNTLGSVKEIRLGWNGLTSKFNMDDALEMAAYGKFAVGKIYACGSGEFELDIAMQPVIEE